MLLDPGPIPAITSDWYDQTIYDPGNLVLVNSWDAQLGAVVDAMEATIAAEAVIDAVLPDDGNDDDLAAIGAVLTAIGDPDTSPIQALGDSQMSDLSGQMLVAYGVTPQEAFQQVPNQLLTPIGQNVTPPAATSTAGIQNLTRPGDTNFYPGDQYEIDISLAPVPGGGGVYAGVGVTMYTSQGTTAWAPANLCLTDQYGRLAVQGTFQQTDVGNWIAMILPGSPATAGAAGGSGGLATTYQFDWTVFSGPGAAAPPNEPAPDGATGLVLTQTEGQPCEANNVTVLLSNVSNPGAVNFTSGDYWQLNVGGPPNAQVVIWATFNGAPLVSEILGTTDQYGDFELTGQMSDPYIGAWVESYSVGGEVWSGTLVFNVVEAPPNLPTAPVV